MDSCRHSKFYFKTLLIIDFTAAAIPRSEATRNLSAASICAQETFLVSLGMTAMLYFTVRIRSAALEFCRAFLKKGVNPFQAIVRGKASHLMLHFRLQSLSKSVFLASEQRLFDGAYGDRRASGKPRRKFFHLEFQLCTRHYAIDESQFERRLRINDVAGVKHLGGFRRADQLR